jgi:hypothetical protein
VGGVCALVLHPLVLCLLVWLVARSTAEIGFGRMFLIALVVGVIGAALSAAVGDYLGLLTLIPVGGLLIYLLMKYCAVTLPQALLVTGLYFAYQILFVVLMDLALQ